MEGVMGKMNHFIHWAKNNGWNIVSENNSIKNLPEVVMDRYNIPNEYKTFLENIKICTNAEENIWFFCIKDYLADEENTFKWNEFELMSLDAADDDKELIDEIKGYWDKHLPIMFNVKGEYEYYAINIKTKEIVYGYEPMFEESGVVANNFDELLEKIMNREIEL
jgi:hypothetical protein